MGGTEIYQPLESVIGKNKAVYIEGYDKVVFLITDG
jgi:hypothetical protein